MSNFYCSDCHFTLPLIEIKTHQCLPSKNRAYDTHDLILERDKLREENQRLLNKDKAMVGLSDMILKENEKLMAVVEAARDTLKVLLKGDETSTELNAYYILEEALAELESGKIDYKKL